MSRRHTFVLFVAFAALVVSICEPADAQGRGFGRRLRRSRNHDTVKQAFIPTVKQAAQSTVRVYKDNKPASLGTVVSSEGLILTKYSELFDEDGALSMDLVCELPGGAKHNAKVFGVYERDDLAMLKIDVKGLKPIEWSDKTVSVGSWLATAGLDEKPVSIGVLSVGDRDLPKSPFAWNRALLGVQLHERNSPARVVAVTPNSAAA